MCCRGWERLAACFDGWLHCQNHLGSAEQPPVLLLYVACPRLPATFTCPGCVSFQAQSSCALPRRWSPCGELGVSPPVVPQSTLRRWDESSCCDILSSLLPGGPGNRRLGFIPFWFISPFVVVFLTDPPDWVPDEVCSYCTACKAPFTVIRRKHHCRSCGKVITQADVWEMLSQRAANSHIPQELSCTAKRVLLPKIFKWQVLSYVFCQLASLFKNWWGWETLTSIQQFVLLKAELPVEAQEPAPRIWSHSGLLLSKLSWTTAACTGRVLQGSAAGTACPFVLFHVFAGWLVHRAAALQVWGGRRGRIKQSQVLESQKSTVSFHLLSFLFLYKVVKKLVLITL